MITRWRRRNLLRSARLVRGQQGLPRVEALEDRTLLTAAGVLDPAFGTGGKVVTGLTGSVSNVGLAAALQNDGKIVTVGSVVNAAEINGVPNTTDFALTRTNPDGALDTSFGASGRVSTHLAATATATAVVVQSDGKIVVAGTVGFYGSGDFAVARYNPDGSLDRSFGKAGTVVTDFSGGDDNANAVVLQANGKIVVAGSTYSSGSFSFALARYDSDGSLDAGFGSGGQVMTATAQGRSGANAVAIQPDGRIIATGGSYDNRGTLVSYPHAVLIRYNADGTLDTTFAKTGETVITFDPLASDQAYAVLLQPDGKIVTAGSTGFEGNPDRAFALARFNPDGSLDTSFNQTGMVTTAINTYATAFSVQVQSDGKIVAAGQSGSSTSTDFALARYNSDGSLDSSYGQGDGVVTDFGAADTAHALLLQSDGKVVAAGSKQDDKTNHGSNFLLARYNADGSLDTLFGTNGRAIYDFTGPIAVDISGIAIQGDGNIIAAGTMNQRDQYFFAVARYTPEGKLDTSFGTGGWATTGLDVDYAHASAVVLLPDGKILIAGTGGPKFDVAIDWSIEMMRYNRDGSLDSSFGQQGRVTTYLDGVLTPADISADVALQSDAKIVVVSSGRSRNLQSETMFAARYDPDGVPDASFGSAGKVNITFAQRSAGGASVAIQPDGKIIAAGTVSRGPLDASGTFGLARLNADGSLDMKFGSGGLATIDIGGTAQVNDVALQADGKIVENGSKNYSQFALARFNADGSPDASFGSNDVVMTSFGGTADSPAALVIQLDGKIVVAGTFQKDLLSMFAVARYNADGSLDPSFGAGGKVTTGFNELYPRASALALQSNGDLVVGGYVDFSSQALARYVNPLSPNVVLVNAIYRQLLGRPADAGGLLGWVNWLAQGAGRAQVVAAIEQSQEYRAKLVDSYYTTFLGRPADPAGEAGFVNALGAGMTIEQIKAIVLGSPEYYQDHGGTITTFLQALYRDVLHRHIDASGAATWESGLAYLDRTTVAASIVTSPESQQDLVQFVYQQYLHRSADSSGLGNWLTDLQHGMSDQILTAYFLGSDEFFGRL